MENPFGRLSFRMVPVLKSCEILAWEPDVTANGLNCEMSTLFCADRIPPERRNAVMSDFFISFLSFSMRENLIYFQWMPEGEAVALQTD